MLEHEWMATGKSTVALLCIDLRSFLNNFFINQGNKWVGQENLGRISGFPETKHAKHCISQKVFSSLILKDIVSWFIAYQNVT